jgi:uncharacterized membrane protein
MEGQKMNASGAILVMAIVMGALAIILGFYATDGRPEYPEFIKRMAWFAVCGSALLFMLSAWVAVFEK